MLWNTYTAQDSSHGTDLSAPNGKRSASEKPCLVSIHSYNPHDNRRIFLLPPCYRSIKIIFTHHYL